MNHIVPHPHVAVQHNNPPENSENLTHNAPIQESADLEHKKPHAKTQDNDAGVRAFLDSGESCWMITVVIEDTKLEMLVDSGASKSLIDTEVFNKCFPDKIPSLHQPNEQMWAANDTAMQIDGECEVTIQIGSKQFFQSVAINKSRESRRHNWQ